ncbi:polysaccharide biosynthesis/export family protein [Jiella sp. M17.18]|uniref:polysaccharide biosynthesis/export family protein n=1 Tax=Jiella sp. M17.18 TaxID=3234247 RepID=UPI0034DEF709
MRRCHGPSPGAAGTAALACRIAEDLERAVTAPAEVTRPPGGDKPLLPLRVKHQASSMWSSIVSAREATAMTRTAHGEHNRAWTTRHPGPRPSILAAGAVAIGALLLVQAPVRADDAAASRPAAPSQSATAAPQKFALAPGDRISIVVFEQQEISGVYFVEPDGSITMPLLGAIAVSGLTPQALQRQLVARFSDGYLQNPVVSVRLAELRPVTVLGDVRSPGRYTFIDGMNVETLLALAGGAARLSGEEAAQRADFLQSDERVKTLTIAYLGQLARKARLEAQLKGSALSLPAVAPENAATFKAFVAGEKQVLEFEVASQARQAALLREQTKQAKTDIDTFSKQVDLENQQIAFLDSQIADVKSLLINGLTRKSTLIDIEREKSKSRANLATILGSLARAKSLVTETDLKLQDLDSAYRSRIMAELQTTMLQIAESESTLPIAVEARQMKRDRLPAAARQVASAPLDSVPITIRRFGNGTIRSIPADRSFEIWPGDIVQVGDGTNAALPGGVAGGNPLRLTEPGAAPVGTGAAAASAPVTATGERVSLR